MTDQSTHRCPECGGETTYQAFSGGREWYCPGCGADGSYPDGEAPVRAALLQTEDGLARLRGEMRAELDRRHGDAAAPRLSVSEALERVAADAEPDDTCSAAIDLPEYGRIRCDQPAGHFPPGVDAYHRGPIPGSEEFYAWSDSDSRATPAARPLPTDHLRMSTGTRVPTVDRLIAGIADVAAERRLTAPEVERLRAAAGACGEAEAAVARAERFAAELERRSTPIHPRLAGRQLRHRLAGERGAPIQGSGYTPAELLGAVDDPTTPEAGS